MIYDICNSMLGFFFGVYTMDFLPETDWSFSRHWDFVGETFQTPMMWIVKWRNNFLLHPLIVTKLFPKPIRMNDFLQLLFPFSPKFTLCNCCFPFSIFQGKSGARLGNWPPRSGTFRIACESFCDSLFWWGTSCQLDLGTQKNIEIWIFHFFFLLLSPTKRWFRSPFDTFDTFKIPWLWLTVCHGKIHHF